MEWASRGQAQQTSQAHEREIENSHGSLQPRKCLQKIERLEDGLVNDQQDRGGEA